MNTDTKFKPGESGNPKGRPRGSGDPVKLIRPHVRTLIERCLAAGLSGDVGAASAVLNFYSANALKKP